MKVIQDDNFVWMVGNEACYRGTRSRKLGESFFLITNSANRRSNTNPITVANDSTETTLTSSTTANVVVPFF